VDFLGLRQMNLDLREHRCLLASITARSILSGSFPVRDVLSFGIWIAGFFSNEIIWRGLGYRVRKGRLFPILSSGRAAASSVGIRFLNNQLSANRQNLPRS
jgi:hypothetical protein